MAQVTNTVSEYDIIGIREDLTNDVFNVDKRETAFLSNISRNASIKNTLHEWQTDTYNTPPSTPRYTAQPWTIDARNATVRLNNRTEILGASTLLSGTSEAVEIAGRASQFEYEKLKIGVELKRGIETRLIGRNGAKVAGDDATPRQCASVLSWIKSNTSAGSAGADPSAADGTGTRTDGTQRAFTEEMMLNVIQSRYTNTGMMSDVILIMGAFNKRVFSGFPGLSEKKSDVSTGVSYGVTDVYMTDFGKIEAAASLFSRSRDALMLDKKMWKVGYLRPMEGGEILPGAVDGKAYGILCEYTLECRNELSSGGVFDLLTA